MEKASQGQGGDWWPHHAVRVTAARTGRSGKRAWPGAVAVESSAGERAHGKALGMPVCPEVRPQLCVVFVRVRQPSAIDARAVQPADQGEVAGVARGGPGPARGIRPRLVLAALYGCALEPQHRAAVALPDRAVLRLPPVQPCTQDRVEPPDDTIPVTVGPVALRLRRVVVDLAPADGPVLAPRVQVVGRL